MISDSRGFSASVMMLALLLFSCMISRNFESNVSVMIGDAKHEAIKPK